VVAPKKMVANKNNCSNYDKNHICLKEQKEYIIKKL